MKKSLVALAALAATGAFAQSTVTIYGQADAAYTSIKSGANKQTGLFGAGRGSNFVGFMGSEDLGGGLKANFKLEAGYNIDNGTGAASNTNNQLNGGPVTITGTSATAATTGATGDRYSIGGAQGLTFNRWSYVGVSGGFGEVRAGREYTPTFQAVLGPDTTGANGVQNTLFQTLYIGQANSHATATSASNGISYESPSFNGLKVKIQTFFGENTSPTAANSVLQPQKAGDGNSYHVSYAAGKLSAGFGAQTTKGTAVAAGTVGNAGAAGTAVPGKYDVSTAYVKYDLGMALLTAGQTTEKLVSAADGNLKNKSTVIGASIPVSGALKINGTYTTSKYSDDGVVTAKASQLGLQALYSLSKRTDLYANYAVTDNKTGKLYGIVNGAGRPTTVAADGDKTTGYQVGVRHNF